ncbi:recombinase family protein [Chloroflexota bacterium]
MDTTTAETAETMPCLSQPVLEQDEGEELWAKEKDKTMKAAIYCRVSSEGQERDGTSLQTQMENCVSYCQGKGYEVSYRFSEAYSGLSLERPELDKLRELVRASAVYVVVCYSLDRLSRNATHGVILRDELDKYHVSLESVTEDIDKTPLGEAITYLRGTFAQIEAEKIKERTMRGKKARANEGSIPCGGYGRLYGYNYISVKQKDGGRRVINETEASWVRQMFQWLVDEGIATFAISQRLNEMNVTTKYGNRWSRKTVWGILTNPAYTGKTIYTSSEIIELKDDITPPIIDEAQFIAAQRQLEVNAAKAKRNTKRDYLLHGHIFCRHCGRPYWSHFCGQRRKYGYYEYRRYVCSGTINTTAPFNRCHNKGWQADKLEILVWNELERYLSDRNLIAYELERQRQDANQIGVLEVELQQVERQIKVTDHDQQQLLQWAL